MNRMILSNPPTKKVDNANGKKKSDQLNQVVASRVVDELPSDLASLL